METSPLLPPTKKPRGIPLWTALLMLLAVALVALAALGTVFYYMHGQKAKVQAKLDALEAQKKLDELDRQKGAEEAKRTLALNRQKDVLAQVRAATNSIEHVLAELNKLKADAAALKSNDDGKRVALHSQLVSQARAFYDTQIPTLPAAENIITRLEAIRRIEQQILSKVGTAYEPEPELAAEAQKATLTSDQDGQKLAQVRANLSSLLQESKIKYTTATITATSPTLEAAIKQLTDVEVSIASRTLADQTAQAKDQAAQTLAKAEAQRIIDDANREATKIRVDAEDKKAALEREIALKKAGQQTEDAKTKVAVDTAADEARKLELRKKASDPQVQVLLAPFITPGYWQLYETGLEKKPLSLTKLKASGALEPTQKGGSVMALIVSTSTDKARPRWDINPKLYTRRPEAIERIRQVQQLLTELGPVLVEMGKLQP